jgi:nucleoside-diphosphate-sugar epimerase
MTTDDSSSPERICIIGSAGFIGTSLHRALANTGLAGAVTTVDLLPDANSVDHHAYDIARDDILSGPVADRAIGTIIHLAAAHRDDIRPLSIYHDVNVTGAENVCALADKTGAKRIVFTSSVAVYGFAEANTGEDGKLLPFNEYGRTKALAEEVFRKWQAEDPEGRGLVIVRPTVVFGEGNRGNVYNLLRQIASGAFVMIGDGTNRKSMAYVENVAAFLSHALSFGPGLHIYNYIDKPDFEMNDLVALARTSLGKSAAPGVRLPKGVGMVIGHAADVVARITGRSLPVSAIRVEKFCATTQFDTRVSETGFVPPVPLRDGLARTIQSEFVGKGNAKGQAA